MVSSSKRHAIFPLSSNPCLSLPSEADCADIGGVFSGGPAMKNYAKSIQNAYAMIFVPDSLSAANSAGNPLELTWNEAAGTGSLGLAYTSYADCAPGGMMGAVCMSSWSVAA